jgi:hypothetical protein
MILTMEFGIVTGSIFYGILIMRMIMNIFTSGIIDLISSDNNDNDISDKHVNSHYISLNIISSFCGIPMIIVVIYDH